MMQRFSNNQQSSSMVWYCVLALGLAACGG